nr:condensin complex subunit 3 [Hymenolepis microstoma]
MVSATPQVPLIVSIFNECQETSLSHDRLIASLTDLYMKIPFSHFAEDFFELCRYSLLSADRTAARERTIDFIVRSIIHIITNAPDRNDGKPRNLLLIKTFLFCSKYHECVKYAPRFRCTQLIYKLLEAMGTESCIPVELFDVIQRVLLRRSKDIKPMVRVQAALGLARLQNPTDRKCPVIDQLLWLCRHDTSSDVRRAALAAIVLTTFTLTSVVERCRDVSDAVRKTAYTILANRAVVRPLSIAKRIAILQDGLTDTSMEVRKAAQQMVLAWFNFLDKDPILLLRRLDTEGVPKTSKLCLDNLLPILSEEDLIGVITKWSNDYLDEKHIPKPDRCSVECVFFWRVIFEYLLKKQKACEEIEDDGNEGDNSNGQSSSLTSSQIASLLERVTPTVTNYVDFVISRVDSLLALLRADADYNENVMEVECVLEHVLMVSESLDLTDEFGRRRLLDVVRAWLVCPQVPASLTKYLLDIFFKLETNVQSRVVKMTEMTSELLEASEDDVKKQQRQQKLQEQQKASDGNVNNGPAFTNVSNTPIAAPSQPEMIAKPINKARETFLRIKVAELKVKLNELNESLSECVRLKNFERATTLQEECNRLDSERSLLMREIMGFNIQATPVTTTTGTALPSAGTSIKREPPPAGESIEIPVINVDSDLEEEEEDEDEEMEENGNRPNMEITLVRRQLKYLSRLSADVVLKSNKMVVVTIQKSPTLWTLPPSLRSLLYNLILPSVQHADLAVRNQAILALGLCCTLDLTLSKTYLTLFYEALKMDHPTVRVTAVGCIIDILVVFGIHPFLEIADKFEETSLDLSDLVLLKSSHSAGVTLNASASETISLALRILGPLVELIDFDDADLRTASGVGMAKLFIFGRLLSGRLISRLLLLWFNQQTSELPTLSQTLGVFFTDFVCSSQERQSCVADAVLPTLSSLVAAPATSPLSDVDPGLVVDLLVRLTDAASLFPTAKTKAALSAGEEYKSTDNPCHDDLAMRLSNQVLNSPQSAEARLYIRVLGQLRLSLHKPQLYKDQLRMVNLMLKKAERHCILTLHRFKKNILTSITSSGLDVNDFLEDVVQQSNPTAAALLAEIPDSQNSSNRASPTPSEDQPALLALPGATQMDLEEVEGAPRRNSVKNHEHMGNALASLSFRGPSVPSTMLVFTDDEESDSEREKEVDERTTQNLPLRGATRLRTEESRLKEQQEEEDEDDDVEITLVEVEEKVTETPRATRRRVKTPVKSRPQKSAAKTSTNTASRARLRRPVSPNVTTPLAITRDTEKMPPPTSTVRRTARLRSSTTSTTGTTTPSVAPSLPNVRRTPRRASTRNSSSRN